VSGHERERLSAYLDEELPPGERAVVEAHLAACPECAAFLAELAAVDEAAAALPVEAPEGYFDAFPARVRARLRPARAAVFPAGRVPVWTWAAAAALLLAVVTPLTLRQLRPSPAAAPPAAAVTLPPAPVKSEAERAEGPRRPEAPPTAPPARPAPREKRGAAPAAAPPEVPAPGAAPYPREAEAAKDQATGEGFFAPEPGAPPPPGQERAAPAMPADVESPRAAGDVRSEALANRAERGRVHPRPAATAEAASPALSAASTGGAAGSAGIPELEDAFLRLEAARPRSASEWRRLRDEWGVLATTETDPLRADEARVRAIEAAREAWRAGGDESDGRGFRLAAVAYLRREDARQKPRVERLLAEP
jgi:hypothetical protein